MVNPHDDPIELVEPKYEEWRAQFEAERSRLSSLFERLNVQASVHRVEHVGSTALPQLQAKDIVDIDIIVADEAVSRISSAIESELGGTRHQNSDGWHPIFRQEAGQRFNDHVFGVSDPGWRVSVATKVVLRERPTLRRRYEQVKRREASATDDLVTYGKSKSAVVSELLEAAKESDIEFAFEIPTS